MMIELLLILATGAFLFILLQLRMNANDKQKSEAFFNKKKEKHKEEKIEPGSLQELAIKYKPGDDIRPYIKLDRIDIIAGTPINPEYEIRTKK